MSGPATDSPLAWAQQHRALVRHHHPVWVHGALLLSLEHADLDGDADPGRPAGT